MTVKTIQLPNGRTVRFGRKKPIVRFPFLKLKNYLSEPTVPVPPSSIDYTSQAAPALIQMYGNDQYGDCVIACIEHTVGVLTGNANPPPVTFTDTQTISFYSKACGYVPGNPSTDQGCDVQTSLTYWANHGAADDPNHKIAGILIVDPSNIQECQTAVWLFENLIFGVDLPDAWISPVPSTSGFVWDVAGPIDPNNGHCFGAFGFDSSTFKISTWGMVGSLSNAAVSLYASASNQGELYTVISQDAINKASLLAPNGLDWNSLVSDFQALGGNLINPTPVPPVPPVVPPSPPIPPTPPGPPMPNIMNDLIKVYIDSQQLTADIEQLIMNANLLSP